MLKKLIVASVLTASLWTVPVHAAAPKTYQVTGPVLELTENTITVQKGDEKWQVAREPGTKVKGDLKVGSKVTIEYQMVAKDVEVKADKKK